MTNQSDGWLTIREAALGLGVSELTIRRRIKGGRVAHRVSNGKYYVNLSVGAIPGTPAVVADTTEPEGRPEEEAPLAGPLAGNTHALLADVSRLAERAGRAEVLEEQLARLQEEHRALRADLVTLTGRNGWLASKLEERERELLLLADSSPKRSWWKRLFRG